MAYRVLELTLVSARELKNVNLITRMDVYAVVTISGDPLTRQCTAPDPSGGRNPRWDATLRFAVAPTAAAAAGSCLHVLLRAERVLGDRDIGEVVVPLADLLAGAPAAGPQQPQVASYQVRKVHRWEPRGVLNVAYRLGPVVAPVEAAERKPPPAVMGMAYPDAPVGVPSSQPFQPPAGAYQPPPPPRPAAKAKHDPAPAPAPSPSPRRGKSNGLGLEGPTQVIVGPHTQIILGGGGPATTAMSSPTGSTVSSPRKLHGAWPKQELHHDRDDTTYASAAQSIFSPRKEDHSRPKVFPDHDAQGRRRSFQETEATSQRSVVSPSSREPGTVSPGGPSPARRFPRSPPTVPPPRRYPTPQLTHSLPLPAPQLIPPPIPLTRLVTPRPLLPGLLANRQEVMPLVLAGLLATPTPRVPPPLTVEQESPRHCGLPPLWLLTTLAWCPLDK